jgi:hypothetical protein
MQRGEGERLFAAKRRRFWGWIVGLMLAGAVAGLISGALTSDEHKGVEALTSLPQVAKFGIVAVLIAVFALGCWHFVREVDELEIADNLWSSTAGYYAYATLLPAWWLLWKLEAVGEPDHWAIFLAAALASLAVYFGRKWHASR